MNDKQLRWNRPGPGSGRRRRMMFPGNVRYLACCLAATLLFTLPTARAQQPAALQAPLLDWSHVQQVHRLVEDWASAAAVPAAGDVPALQVSGAPALRVTLRWLGLTVGTGDAWAGEQGGSADHADLAAMARQATARALAELANRLQRQAAAADTPAEPSRNALRDVAGQLLVDVQVAHNVQRISLDATTPPEVVYSRFIAGYHGLRLHRPGDLHDLTAAMIWPGNAIAANLSPRSQLLQLLADLKIGHDQLNQIARAQGPVLERFEVIHIVRPQRHLPPTRLQRGHVVLPTGSLDSRTLEAMSQRLVEHLLSWQNLGDGTLAGTYLPTSDRHDPPQAAPEDEALAAYALSRWASVWARLAGQVELIEQAQQAVARLVNNVVRAMDQQPPSPPVAALILLTIQQSSEMSVSHKSDRDALAKWLFSCVDGEGAIRAAAGNNAARLNVPSQALVLSALAVHTQQTREPQALQTLGKIHGFQWRHRAVTEIAALPWLALTEASIAGLELPPLKDVPDAAARRQQLRQAADMLLQRQVIEAPEHGPADVVGGFDLRPTNPPSLGPDPDWQSAHPLLLLAMGTRHQLLQSPDAAAGDTLTFLLRSGLAARFLAQLMFDESSSYYVRNLRTTLGGVRLSLWDNRLAIPPHAMTLLATAELQHALLAAREQALR